MGMLRSEFRKLLDQTVVHARETAELAAKQSLEALAVHYHEPFAHLTTDQRDTRIRLRTHARQLGDSVDNRSGRHSIDQLIHECAYEHWHRMLFVRFLSENELLIEPESQVAVTLDECDDLGRELSKSKWHLASEFAQRMLPQVFKPDHVAFEVVLAPEHQRKLERLVDDLPQDVFVTSDSLGWVYQFWQSRKKDDINASEIKIGADELPAVTQLFTEPYMVRFLLDNTLGAWFVNRCPNTPCPVELKYLRLCDDGQTANSDLEGWPRAISDLQILDPCCGSGHFLVGAFRMLVPMREAIDHVSVSEAIDSVLRENIFGLEIDPRCVAIAAFSLAFAAWTYPGSEGYRQLPTLNLACSGMAPNMSKKEWARLAEMATSTKSNPELSSSQSVKLKGTLDALYDLFLQGPLLGSLIDPTSVGPEVFRSEFAEVRSALLTLLQVKELNLTLKEGVIAAQGLARAAELLSNQFVLVITNVPYLGRGKQSEGLRKFCAKEYPAAKGDLATVFLRRCLKLCTDGGSVGLVLPQNWMSQMTYAKLRGILLRDSTWHLVARLGERAFNSVAGFNVAMLTLSHSVPISSQICLLDVSASKGPVEKAEQLGVAETIQVAQAIQLKHPDHIIASSDLSGQLLSKCAGAFQGISTGDNFRYRRKFWELPCITIEWRLLQRTVSEAEDFGGREHILRYLQTATETLRDQPGAVIRGASMWNKAGVTISQMRSLPATRYTGELFDNNCSAVGPAEDDLLAALWCYCSSPKYNAAVREIDQAVKVTNATLTKVSFDPEYWTQIARDQYPNGLPEPYSNDPTQWLFHGHPCGSVNWNRTDKRLIHGPLRCDSSVLHIAVARLLGYQWPAEFGRDMHLSQEQYYRVELSAALEPFADNDGIVCIPSVRSEFTAEQRLLDLLAQAYGSQWSSTKLARLLSNVKCASLDNWLRTVFFQEHCRLFHQRPFIWHIWDGRKHDGFHALVNYHNLAAPDGRGRQTLESLTYSYLGEWIDRRKHDQRQGKEGAEDRLAAAQQLQSQLKAILIGEPPYDIFVRWKPIIQQPIGWEPDLNDGIRINIRPFMAHDLPNGRKGAGILRYKPTIHWKKDRGKEARCAEQDYPWFWNDGTFTANRVNDLHLTRSHKESARRQEAQSAHNAPLRIL